MKFCAAVTTAAVTVAIAAFSTVVNAGGTTPAAVAYANSIIFNRTDLVTCTLWLDRNRRYEVFCKRPPPSVMATAAGPWELESREGGYKITGNRICLRPDAVPGTFGIAVDGVLYGDSGCYNFQLEAIGASWTIRDRRGRDYTMRILEGR